jgi:hypothetical protein
MAKAFFKAPPLQKDVRFYAVRLPRVRRRNTNLHSFPASFASSFAYLSLH